jgi:hypothetical protein
MPHTVHLHRVLNVIALGCAVNATGIGIKPRYSHHLLVTLDSFAALGR